MKKRNSHYYRRKSAEKVEVLQSLPFFIFTVIVVLTMDMLAIYEVEDYATELMHVDNLWSVWLICASILLSLDGVSLLLGHFMKFSRKIMSVLCVIALSTALILPGFVYVVQRFTFSDAVVMMDEMRNADEEDDEEDEESENSVSEVQMILQEDANYPWYAFWDKSALWKFKVSSALLMVLMPIVTSVVSFSISVLRTEGVLYLDAAAIETEIEEKKNEYLAIQNRLKTVDFHKEIDQSYQATLNEINILNRKMKSEFLKELMKTCKDTEAINLVSHIAVSPPPRLASANVLAGMPPQASPQIPMPPPEGVRRFAKEDAFAKAFVPREDTGTEEIDIPEDTEDTFFYDESVPQENDPYYEEDD